MSQGTVSRALRGDPRLSDETRRRIAETARILQYVPSQRGRSLATRSTGQIGIVVADLGNSFYLQVLDTLHRALQTVDLRMLVLTSDARDSVAVQQLVDGSLDGVILTTTLLDSTLPGALARRSFPFVLLNREVDDCPGDVCVVDNDAGGRLAARELLSLGHTEIAAVFGPENTSTGRARERSFRAVLSASGVSLPPRRWRRSPYDFAAGRERTLELLDARARLPTALFCGNDMIALGAFDALRQRGLRLPEDVTLIGFDDILLAGWEAFQLTTVRQDIERMVRSATDLLLARIGGDVESPPRRVVLSPELIRRRTHGPPRAHR